MGPFWSLLEASSRAVWPELAAAVGVGAGCGGLASKRARFGRFWKQTLGLAGLVAAAEVGAPGYASGGVA